jgi:hypothetical protein
MASGYKDGPPPSHLYVIKNDYEIRYYTTPETYAQALVEGYQGELAVYRRCGAGSTPTCSSTSQSVPNTS